MNYQALGLGAAASVVTAVTVDTDQHTIMISCLYDPQDTQMPYTLCFKQCEHCVADLQCVTRSATVRRGAYWHIARSERCAATGGADHRCV